MQARMKNPALVIPDAMQSLMSLGGILRKGNVPASTLHLVHLRVSQINGCAFCADMHSRELKQDGASEEKLWTVATWRDSPHFDDKERAALALAEASTRIDDRADPVTDEIWKEATRLYGEQEMATLLLNIAMINFWNRLNVPTRQPPAPMPRHSEARSAPSP